MARAPAIPRELKWLLLAVCLYLCFCLLLLHSEPSSRPLALLSQGRSPTSVSRGPREHRPIREQELSHMTGLLKAHMFHEQGIKLKWIKERITNLAVSWEEAQRSVARERGYLFTRPQKILLFPGLLSEYSAYDFASNAYKGGYLGELVQWSDLIATLHMLGHHVVVLTSREQLSERVSPKEVEYDVLFTDYIGLFALRDSRHFALYKCRIRVLDSFGTEPAYAFRTRDYQLDDSMGMFNNWNFESSRQFWTLFPHTPDNSFLGFVVPAPNTTGGVKSNQAVLYGKEAWYRYGNEEMLSTVAEVIEIHSTFKDPGSTLPAHIVNHGVLPFPELQSLLARSTVFLGLGFPYDGPGPLEALANGCVFLQPAFSPPRSATNTDFLKGKPTSRHLTSQVPYLEHFVGPPYVYTVNMSNQTALKEALYEILENKVHKPFIPHEFTQQGMLERVGSYLAHQNFCDGKDLALGRVAQSSSVYQQHSPGEAVDGLLDEDTCFWSAPDVSHWWSLDLGASHNIAKIRVTNTFEWILAKSWGDVFIDPFIVTLLDDSGDQVLSHRFTDARTFYVWEEVNVRARHIRIDSLEASEPRYFVLCGVEVFGTSSQHPTWPDLTLLSMLTGPPGGGCGEACQREGLVCEPAFFRAINTARVLRDRFNCTSVRTSDKYMDYPPGRCVKDHEEITEGECVMNSELSLLSCAGHHDNYQRLCPCRKFTKGQIAVPRLI